MTKLSQSDHNRWLQHCVELSRRSDDPKTQIGCVIVDPCNKVRSQGWNSLPHNVHPEPTRFQSPAKYSWIEHAERNAIYAAAMHGTPLAGCTLYVQLMPCADCARAIIQSGITRVVISRQAMASYSGIRYRGDHRIARTMFLEAGINVEESGV